MKQSTFWIGLALLCIGQSHLQAQLHFEQFVFEGYGSPFLNHASSVAISPDDRHVYVTSHEAGAISLFGRDPNSGAVDFVEAYKNGVNGLEGLGGSKSVIVSPDGRHVYASGQNENSLLVFSRNPIDGSLEFVERLEDNVEGVSGLEGAYRLKSSADGNQLYLVSPNDNTLSVFTRNVVTGELTQLQLLQDGGSGGNDMTYPLDVVLSPDGAYVYVSSFGDDAVSIFSRNAQDGTLTIVGSVVDGTGNVQGLSGANTLTISPEGKYLYASGETTVVVFERASASGALSYMGHYTDGIDGEKLNGVETLAVSKTGRYLYAVSALEDAISIFEINQITGSMSVVEEIKNNSGDITGMDFPKGLAFTENKETIYISSFVGSSLLQFDVDIEAGNLGFNNTVSVNDNPGLAGIEGAKTVAMSPDDLHVYVGGEIDDGLAIFERDVNTGMLHFLDMFEDGGANDGLNGIRSVTVSPDGAHVYAAGFWDNSVAIFERDAGSGLLTYLGRVKDGLFGVDGLNGVHSVIVSPDGEHVYTAAHLESGVGVFSRNVSTGMLDYETAYFDGVLGVDGLEGVVDLAMSGDGLYLYAAGKNDNAVAVFGRDSSTGELTYVERLKDGESGIDGLEGISAVLVSADGLQVYTCSSLDHAVNMFNRDVTAGTLSLGAIYQDVAAGGSVEGLMGASDLQLSPDGSYLYTTAFDDNAVSVFSRESGSGVLTQEKVVYDGDDLTNGIASATAVAVSLDGRYIYATGFDDDAVGIFSCTIEEELVVTICEGESYLFGGEELTEAGYYEHVDDSGDCKIESTLDLSVSVLDIYVNAEICTGDVYEIGLEQYEETGSYMHTLISSSGCDSVVHLELNVVEAFSPTEEIATICFGESYTLGNNTFDESGSYEVLFSSQLGCDSLVVLELEVMPELIDTFDVDACDESFYVFGTSNYIENGTYSQLFVSEDGCDSLVTIHLNFVPTTYYLEESICEGEIYLLGDDSISTAGTYAGEVVLNSGCEVSVNLVLTVLPVGSSTITAAICEGDYYVFNNVPYTETGSYEAAYPMPNGCDSIVTLELTVYPTDIDVEATICEGESYEVGNELFDESGNYEVSLDSYNGCDSVVHLLLEVIPSEGVLEVFMCDGETYELGGITYTESGIYNQVVIDDSGCSTAYLLFLEELNPVESVAVIANDNGIDNGAIDLSVSEGLAPYTYQWSNGASSEDIDNLSEGLYTVIITDSQGCAYEFTYEVGFSTSAGKITPVFMQMELLPNLVERSGIMRLQVQSPKEQAAELRLIDNVGRLLSQVELSLQQGVNVQPLQAPEIVGVYYIQVYYEGGQEVLKFSVTF